MLVVCNGMARGGSTLQYNLVRVLLSATEGCEAHGYAHVNPAHNHYVPMEQLTEWAREPAYHLVKVHAVLPGLSDLLRDGRTKVLYIYRDLRDVAVSRQRSVGEKGDALLNSLAKGESQFYELRALRDEHPDCFLWQRYEDVMGAETQAVEAAMALFRVDLPEGIAASDVADACSVDAAKQACDDQRAHLAARVRNLRESDPNLAARYLQAIGRGGGSQMILEYDPESLLLYNHISPDAGASGVWRRLSPAVRDEVVARHRDWRREMGYMEADS